MNRNKFLLVIFLVLFSVKSFSQSGVYDDPSKFGTEIAEMMNRTKSPEAIETGSSFDLIWNGSSLDQGQKEKIISIAKKMRKKNLRSKTHFRNFFDAIVHAINTEKISNSDLNDLLDVISKSVDHYDNKEINACFKTLQAFFSQKALYLSTFNQLYCGNSQYRFEFIEPREIISEETFEETENEEDWFSDWDEEKEEEEEWDTQWEEEKVDDKIEEEKKPIYESPQPTLEGAVLKLENTDLSIITSFDSTTIQNTTGSLMLHNNKFVGVGGRFDWAMAGLSPDSVYCDLNKYNFDISKPKVSAENVRMTYFGMVDTPIQGVFDFESKRHTSPENAIYPRFKSYDNNIKVRLADYDKLIYRGGFALEGHNIYSSSVYSGVATIEVRKDGVKQFESKSNKFILGDSLVESSLASVVIYQHRDSIFHPAIRIKYNHKSDKLVILKDSDRYKYAPFFASHFNMDITADMIKWDLGADSLDISILNARNQVPAYFESQEYFNSDRFKEMVGMYNFHPLFMVVGYARKINSSEFNVDDLIKFSKQPANIVKSAMEFLMSYHFIDYNAAFGDIKVRRKAYHHVLSKNGKKDYDNLLIASKLTEKPNATYNFENQELTVRGIEKFYISELLDVYIIPRNKEIHITKNRDFRFDGQIYAGNFEYVGKDFTFRYDSFLVNLNSIDSVRFYLNEEGKNKQRLENKLVGVDSVSANNNRVQGSMEQTSGTLYLNKPNNKSARKVYPGYPYFDAKTGAIVYFDGEEILGGAYKDKSVFFVIPPFKIDSLSESDIRSVGFNGTFVTSGLLPDFEEKLSIMPDNSLGFVHKAPIDGYSIRGDKGKFYNTITLDKNGLSGKGKVEYLNTTLESEKFVFYVDSIVAEGTDVMIDKGELNGASYPDLRVDKYKMNWLPEKDSMFIHNIESPFQLYESTASLNGFINITPKGVLGGGQLLTRGSEAISEKLSFESNSYSARHAKFKIESNNPDKPALFGDDVRLNFNLVDNIADISPEIEGVAAINFPYAQMKSSITNATWNLDDRTVSMTKPEDIDINSSYFYSTREELDSLAFNAAAAEYDINELKLHVSGIPFIKVADAKITPENNELTILENSVLQPLENATLVIDTLNEYHSLSEGNIIIKSRKEFEGNATYDLIAAVDTFGIEFNSFELEPIEEKRRGKKLQTVSRGSIEEIDNILVSPKIIFKGTATMYATQVALDLEGFVKLDLKKIPNYNTWIEYKSTSLDTQQVIIDYDKIVTADGQQPSSGLHFEANDFNMYSTFVSERKSLGDEDFFSPKGMLFYDESAKVFKIEEPSKGSGDTYSGRSYTYDEENSTVSFEGPLLFSAPQSGLKMQAAGKGQGNLETNEFDINSFMTFDFDLPSQALTSMALDIQDLIERLGIPEAHQDKTKLLYKAAEIIGDRAAKSYEEESLEEYTPLVNLSNTLLKALVISDIDFKWSETDKAFYNPLDSKIGISNILKNDINAVVDGFVEIRKTEEGDVFNMFLKISSSWYYFGFSNNRLVLYSNNDEFNETIKSKSNVSKAKLGAYVFILGEIEEVQNFVDEFRKIYYDINEPYVLDQPVEVEVEEETKKADDDDDDGF